MADAGGLNQGPPTGELASDSLRPPDVEFSSVAASHARVEARGDGVHQTSKDMPAILPPEPSLIEAVDHLTTGEIPQITVGQPAAGPLDFDDEVPDDVELPETFDGRARSRMSFISGMLVSAAIAAGAYIAFDGSENEANPPPAADVGESAELVLIEQLMEAARFEARDTRTARERARSLYTRVLQSIENEERPEWRQAAQYGLARIALADAQYEVLRGSSSRQSFAKAEERLRQLDHPKAALLKLRNHRLQGQTTLFNDGIDGYSGPKDTEFRLERALRQAPTIKADSADRLRRLNALKDDLQGSPTVWALRAEAGLASGQWEAVAKILEAAPRGPDRAYFLKALSESRSQEPVSKTVQVKPVKNAGSQTKKVMKSKPTQPEVPAKTSAKSVQPRAKETSSDSKIGSVDFESIMSRGIALLERGDEERAEAMFLKAADARPKRPEPHTNLGYCAHSRKRYGKAVEHFQHALRLRGGYADALYGLGNAYRAMGRTQQARQTFRRYLDRHPRGAQASMARARLEELGEGP